MITKNRHRNDRGDEIYRQVHLILLCPRIKVKHAQNNERNGKYERTK